MIETIFLWQEHISLVRNNGIRIKYPSNEQIDLFQHIRFIHEIYHLKKLKINFLIGLQYSGGVQSW